MDKIYKIVVCGVGGQGAITAAHKENYNVLQSEVHGMSQRGGSVNAHVIFDKRKVTSPIIMDGTADLIISMEPLEALRYVNLLSKDGIIITGNTPVKNMSTYPDETQIIDELKKIKGTILIDGNNNMTLLGVASKYLPIKDETWIETLKERFKSKSENAINDFMNGKKL